MTQLLGQNYWGGVCGFVSVIHGILLATDGGNALDGLSQDELEWNVGQSILAFLKHVRLSNKPMDKSTDAPYAGVPNHNYLVHVLRLT